MWKEHGIRHVLLEPQSGLGCLEQGITKVTLQFHDDGLDQFHDDGLESGRAV